MKLAVYLPALNEAHTIGDVLDAIPAAIPGATGIAKIVIDDGSTDQTAAIAARHGARVVQHPRNLGTGRAFMSGVQAGLAADADIIVSMDADGQFAPADAALRVDVHSDFEYIHESLLTWNRFGQRVVEVELPVKAERAIGESRIVSSVTDYGLRATPVLIGAIRDYSPLKFFGSLALLAFVPSILIGTGVFVHWWRTGETAPYTSFITVSVGGVLLGVLLGAVAMLADLIARLKFQVEEVLHNSRRLRGRS